METKVCSKCKKPKPATPEYFHIANHSPDNLRCSCIECTTGYPTRTRKPHKTARTYPDHKSWLAAHCIRKKNARNKRLLTLNGSITDLWWNNVNSRQLEKFKSKSDIDIKFLIDLWNKQKGKCFWTGLPLKYGHMASNRHPQKMSLDRLDNSKGYIKGNVVWASWLANCGRGNLPADRFQGVLKNLEESLSQNPPHKRLLPKMLSDLNALSCANVSM